MNDNLLPEAIVGRLSRVRTLESQPVDSSMSCGQTPPSTGSEAGMSRACGTRRESPTGSGAPDRCGTRVNSLRHANRGPR